MKRNLLVIALTIAGALTVALGVSSAGVQRRPASNDEEALKKLMHEWAMRAVQGDSESMEKFMTDNFRGSAEGISFNKKMLKAALKSGQMKVGGWTIDEVRLSIKGNSASATGRSTLSNATYMGKDFSGRWNFTDRFTKQKDGSWRAVSSQSKLIKK